MHSVLCRFSNVSEGGGFVDLADDERIMGATTDFLMILDVQTSEDGFQYRCHVSGTYPPSVFSEAATLTINAGEK